MDLPALFTPESAQDAQYLAIVITDSYVQSALWRFQSHRVELVEKSDLHPYTDEKDCVVQTDVSLQELGKASEGVEEVVFGLEPHWVHQGDVSDLKKPFLKHITQELSLTAIGFVVTIEALHQYLVKTQPQLSALIVQSENAHLRVSFVRQGILLKTEVVGKSGNLVADMTEALARWSNPEDLAAAYPSRILLLSDQLGEEEVTAEEQMILSHDWVSEKLFLHPPVVEVLKTGTLLEAVVNEGGKAVAQMEGVVVKDVTAATPISPTPDEELAIPVPPPASVVAATSFGIPMPVAQPELVAAHLPNETELNNQFDSDEDFAVESASPRKSFNWPLPKFLKARHHGRYSHHPFILSGVGLGLLLLAVSGYGYLRFQTQATLKLVLKTIPVTEDVTINLDPTASGEVAGELKLAAQTMEQEFEKTKSLPTTGIKKIGEKAKGTVTLFNKTTSTKTFAAGTPISAGKLQFTLDSEVTIASASVVTSGSSETKTFGKLEAAATAVEIGVESNIAKNQELKIASFDSGTYAAESATEFVGGASREVRVVAETDRQKILSDLRSEVVSEATAAFKQNSQGATYTVPSGRVTIQSSTYSAKTGDETEEISLTLVATVEGLTYQTDQLKPLALSVLSAKLPAGYDLKPETLQILSEAQPPAGTSSAQVKVAANLAAKAAPKISPDQLKASLAGQSITRAEEMLKADSTISSFVTTFSPSISRWILGSLPAADRLQIETN